MTFLALLISWLNAVLGFLFGLFRSPMEILPAWLMLALFSAVLGVFAMLIFKYTSNQNAIGRCRDRIKAGMLAMKLYKDHIGVVLKSWICVIGAALMLFVYAIPPLLAMMVPFALFMGQLSVWYQSRPLDVNEQVNVVVQLAKPENEDTPMPEVSLDSPEVAEVLVGPVRVPSKHQVFWKIRPKDAGFYQLKFTVNGVTAEKELAVGHKRVPVSAKRPGLNIGDLVLYPGEKPFGSDTVVQSIGLSYPDRHPPFLGVSLWIWALLAISMVTALIVKPYFNVKI